MNNKKVKLFIYQHARDRSLEHLEQIYNWVMSEPRIDIDSDITIDDPNITMLFPIKQDPNSVITKREKVLEYDNDYRPL